MEEREQRREGEQEMTFYLFFLCICAHTHKTHGEYREYTIPLTLSSSFSLCLGYKIQVLNL